MYSTNSTHCVRFLALAAVVGLQPVYAAESYVHATGEQLIQAVKRHAAGCDQNDDITAVCLGRPI